MDEKKKILFIADRIGIAAALVKTASIAIGNKEFFLDDGQGVAVTLDIASTELRRCRQVIETGLQEEAPMDSSV